MPNWTGSWAGGRTYQTKDHRTVWVIRKMVKGHRYQIVLDVETERQALAQLALFDQDPSSYKTPGAQRDEARRQAQEDEDKSRQEAEADAVYVNAPFVGRFLEFIKDRTPK